MYSYTGISRCFRAFLKYALPFGNYSFLRRELEKWGEDIPYVDFSYTKKYTYNYVCQILVRKNIPVPLPWYLNFLRINSELAA